MEQKQQDQLFKQLATQYVESYGQSLQQELEQLEQSGVRYATPRMDRKLRQKIAAQKRRPYYRGMSLVAACVVLMLLIPGVLNLGNSQIETPTADRPEDVQPGSPADLLPLSFTLPDNFSVAGSELDQGQSIYYLNNTQLDDVVMTMEITGEGVVTEGLTPIAIGDATAYGISEPDYSLLTFLRDDVVYVLTCKHDLNTLVSLSKSIL